jgi:hypothetical protein
MNDITAILPDIALRFNVAHPSYEESYVFGYECAHAEVPEEENPFTMGSASAEQWMEGWWAYMGGEMPLFTKEDLAQADWDSQKVSAVNDPQYHHKHGIMTLVIEISGAIAASALVGYQLLELVA